MCDSKFWPLPLPGLLKNKTRVLVTHGVGYLPQMDKIFVMRDGEISEQGTYKELLKQGGDFATFLINYLTEEGNHENPTRQSLITFI